jgi:hypothetical protein
MARLGRIANLIIAYFVTLGIDNKTGLASFMPPEAGAPRNGAGDKRTLPAAKAGTGMIEELLRLESPDFDKQQKG